MKPFFTSLTASIFFAALASAQSPYSLIDLGVLPAPSQPYSLSDNLLIGGASALAGNTEHATLWAIPLAMQLDIGRPGLGGPNSVAYAVNEKAQLAGGAETSTPDPNGEDFCGFNAQGLTSSGACLPFVWQAGSMTPLPTLGGNNGEVSWINKTSEMAGTAENTVQDPACPAPQRFQFKPVTWQNGKIQELPTYPGDPDGFAYAVNDNGDVAGQSGTCAAFNPNTGSYLQSLHAVLWQAGVPTDLGNLGGDGQGGGIGAMALNNHDQVVGLSDLPGDTAFHAFLWAKGTGMQDLGTLPGGVASGAIGINDSGEVIGVSLDANFNPHPFVWQNGAMSDLNTMIPASSPMLALLACAINSSGWIVGYAVDKQTGDMHGYLAVPYSNLSPSQKAAHAEADAKDPVALSDEARRLLQQGTRRGRFGARLPATP
ncbi:MAG: hypothetical protein ABSB15_00520 [Bryobacteraceae bacterium]|jgi:probable HAF family extracellular repeat protein